MSVVSYKFLEGSASHRVLRDKYYTHSSPFKQKRKKRLTLIISRRAVELGLEVVPQATENTLKSPRGGITTMGMRISRSFPHRKSEEWLEEGRVGTGKPRTTK